MENNANSGSGVHYKPPFNFGLGGVPLGNEFAVVTDKDAYAILEAAWSAGIRYYDVSPWYGLGLAERRYGSFLHNKKRSEYYHRFFSQSFMLHETQIKNGCSVLISKEKTILKI